MAYTKGPWVHDRRPFADWGEVRSTSGMVAKCSVNLWGDEHLNKHRREKTDPTADNARLIAAAPDMYEALAAMCDVGGLDDGGDVFEKAKAALAKARGENAE